MSNSWPQGWGREGTAPHREAARQRSGAKSRRGHSRRRAQVLQCLCGHPKLPRCWDCKWPGRKEKRARRQRSPQEEGQRSWQQVATFPPAPAPPHPRVGLRWRLQQRLQLKDEAVWSRGSLTADTRPDQKAPLAAGLACSMAGFLPLWVFAQ